MAGGLAERHRRSHSEFFNNSDHPCVGFVTFDARLQAIPAPQSGESVTVCITIKGPGESPQALSRPFVVCFSYAWFFAHSRVLQSSSGVAFCPLCRGKPYTRELSGLLRQFPEPNSFQRVLIV